MYVSPGYDKDTIFFLLSYFISSETDVTVWEIRDYKTIVIYLSSNQAFKKQLELFMDYTCTIVMKCFLTKKGKEKWMNSEKC